MHIAIVSPGYPYGKTQSYTFVKQLAEALANQGNEISVVSPMSVTRFIVRGVETGPYYLKERTAKGAVLNVYRPKLITVGNLSIAGWSLNNSQYIRAVTKTLEKIYSKNPIDVVYGHFWASAYYAYRFTLKRNLPLFVANGESSLIRCNYEKEFFDALKGVICVSTKCRDESIAQGYLRNGTLCKVIPNAIDTSKFYNVDKSAARKAKGYNEDDFIVGFTGYFIKRKGANRVSEAISALKDPNVKSFFLGAYVNGDKSFGPFCEGILYEGSVNHEEVAEYLNCADVFCLPTLNEGCCNAIVEAMACGLPIISSNLPFNDDILTEENSIRIDPMNVEEIRAAIKTLKDNPDSCKRMSDAALRSAENLTIGKRAEKILNFICNSL